MKSTLLTLSSVLIMGFSITLQSFGQFALPVDFEIAPGSTVTSFSADGSTNEVIDISGVISILFLPNALPTLEITAADLSATTDPTFIEDFLTEPLFFGSLDATTFDASSIDSGAADPFRLVFDPLPFGGNSSIATLTGGFDLTASNGGGLIFDASAVSVPEPSGMSLMAGILAALCVHRRWRHAA